MDDSGNVRDDLALLENDVGKDIKKRFGGEEEMLVCLWLQISKCFLALHSENGIPPQTQFARGINIRVPTQPGKREKSGN